MTINRFSLCITWMMFFVLNSQAQTIELEWAKGFGSTNQDVSFSTAVDKAGNVYTTGFFSGTVDFDPNSSIYNLTSVGNDDVFISKVDANGNLVWAKSIGGTDDDRGRSITVDISGNVYTTGYFATTVDFDPNTGISNLTAEYGDSFISKLDVNGNFVWAKNFAGPLNENGNAIAVDTAGNVYTIGSFLGTVDFDPNAGTSLLTSGGDWDIYISKLNTNGDFVWARSFGGIENDYGYSIAVDISGNVYTTGIFRKTVDFEPGTKVFNLTSAGDCDVFVSKLDKEGDFVWAKSFGGSIDDWGRSIAVDATGNVYTTGNFNGTVDFDPNDAEYKLTTVGDWDVFISKLDKEGNFVWAKPFGGISSDGGWSLVIDGSGNIYTTGSFNQTVDFDPNSDELNLTSLGNSDVFISKLDSSGNFVSAKTFGGVGYDAGYSVAVDASNNIYTTGSFWGTVDFDPNREVFNMTSKGTFDVFVQKMRQSIVSGINTTELNSQLALTVSPNPSNSYFKILISNSVSKSCKLEIVNSIGAQVYANDRFPIGVEQIVCDDLASGLYIARAIIGDKVLTVKIVKE